MDHPSVHNPSLVHDPPGVGTAGPTNPGFGDRHSPSGERAGASCARDGISAWGRGYRAALLALVLSGIGFRAAQYLSQRSFWEDESFIVLNLRDKTAAELLGRLDHDQAAPPLFLLIQRGVVVTLGPTEFGLRLLPLAAGIGSLL